MNTSPSPTTAVASRHPAIPSPLSLPVNSRMTSLELAELVNKEHKHICRDIRSMLDKLRSEKYVNLDKDAPEYDRGTRKQCKYIKPSSLEKAIDHFKGDGPDLGHGIFVKNDERGYVEYYMLDFEASMTLVTGYDIKRRNLVIKRWIALETGEAIPAVEEIRQAQQAPSELIDNADRFAAYKRMAEIAGFDGNQATLSANSAMVRNHCFDPLALLGVTHLIADTQEQDLTPTLVGVELGNLTPRQVNKLLIDQNFQRPIKDADGRVVSYTPTEKGKPFSILKDTKRKHGDGTPVKQLLWHLSIVDELKEVAA